MVAAALTIGCFTPGVFLRENNPVTPDRAQVTAEVVAACPSYTGMADEPEELPVKPVWL